VKEVLAKLKMTDKLAFFDISTPDGRIEALNNMVMGTPAVVIDEELVTKEILLDRKNSRRLCWERFLIYFAILSLTWMPLNIFSLTSIPSSTNLWPTSVRSSEKTMQ